MSVQIILRKMMQTFHFQKQPFRGALKKSCSENMQQIYRWTPMSKCDFKNRTSARVFSCKLATYFQNNFSKEHLRVATSAL